VNGAPSLELLSRFRAAIAEGLGLTVEETRLGALGELLLGRAAARRLSVPAYLERLESALDGEELRTLASELTVGETYFFRHREQFEALRSIVLSEFAQPGRQAPRVLSAGCSSGEEPYSIAMLLRELLPEREVVVSALDINAGFLGRAREGRYSAWSLREMSDASVSRWLTPAGKGYVVAEVIRRSVAFISGNLTRNDSELFRPRSYDVIFCRNVLMYFTPEQRHGALERLTNALVPGGHLFLGSAETLRGESHDFHLCHTHGAFYYRRKTDAERAAAPPPSRPAQRLGFIADAFAVDPAGPPRDAEPPSETWVDDIGRAAERIAALSRNVPTSSGVMQSLGKVSGWTRSEFRAPLELLHEERFGHALEHVRALPAHASQDPDALLLEAVLLSSEGKLTDAERSAQRLLELDELNAGAHYVLALCAAGSGKLEEATRNDRIAIYLDPAFAMPHLHLGLMLRKTGETRAASQELARAQTLLEREDSARILLFGGGFGRSALLELCAAELCAAELAAAGAGR
jgi:chemotaxis protein methyltransferase CheR